MIYQFHYQIRLLTYSLMTPLYTYLYVYSKSLDEVTTISYDLYPVDTWFKQNRMSINSTNSKVLFITSKGNSCRVVSAQPQIHLNDSLIETCSSAKLLGVTVNTSLSWSTHKHGFIKNCNSYLYLLSRIKVSLSVDNGFIMHTFFHSLTIVV